MTQRNLPTASSDISIKQHYFRLAKESLSKQESLPGNSFMKLFQADKSQIQPADIDDIAQFYAKELAPHLLTIEDLLIFIKIFMQGTRREKSRLEQAALYTLIQCYHLYQNQFQQIHDKLKRAGFTLLQNFEDFHAAQITLQFTSRNNVSDITPADIAVVFGKSLYHFLNVRLKPFPDNQEMAAHTTYSVSQIAQQNAQTVAAILHSCHDELKYTLSFKGKLSILKLLREFDDSYMRACDQLQTAHDEGRYLSVRFIKHIYPVLTKPEERMTIFAEIPESVRQFYTKKFSRTTASSAKTVTALPAQSLRLYQRRGDAPPESKPIDTRKTGRRR